MEAQTTTRSSRRDSIHTYKEDLIIIYKKKKYETNKIK